MTGLTESLLERAEALIGAGELAEAVDLLLPAVQTSHGKIANELTMQAARLQRVATRERKGTLTTAEADAASQRVGFALLDLLDQLRSLAASGSTRHRSPREVHDTAKAPISADESGGASKGTYTADQPAVRDQVFVCYSHEDRDWLKRLQRMLNPLIQSGAVDLWDDTRIRPGTQWRSEINVALRRAAVAVLLVSDNLLSSAFVMNEELPLILDSAASGQLTVLWVYLSPCLYEESPIAALQAAHDVSQPLDALPKTEQQESLKRISQTIKRMVDSI